MPVQNDPADSAEEVHTVYTLPRHEGEEIHFELRKYKGRHYVDLRLWFQTDPKDEFKPTKKGISLAAERLPELVEGLNLLSKAFSKAQEWENQRSAKTPQKFQRRPESQNWRGRPSHRSPYEK